VNVTVAVPWSCGAFASATLWHSAICVWAVRAVVATSFASTAPFTFGVPKVTVGVTESAPATADDKRISERHAPRMRVS